MFFAACVFGLNGGEKLGGEEGRGSAPPPGKADDDNSPNSLLRTEGAHAPLRTHSHIVTTTEAERGTGGEGGGGRWWVRVSRYHAAPLLIVVGRARSSPSLQLASFLWAFTPFAT